MNFHALFLFRKRKGMKFFFIIKKTNDTFYFGAGSL